AAVAFLDTLDKFTGWKTLLTTKGAWIQYNAVDFGKDRKRYKSVTMKAASEEGGTIQIRLNNVNGKLISEIKMPKGKGMSEVKAKLSIPLQGVNNLVMILKDEVPVEVDWIRFE
ncbi:MAG TPA: carbohydrate-binding protein, partial [Bacteroidales bacterium]|nr:carbohydrate-binding protein [Bacteroidales bacterium]